MNRIYFDYNATTPLDSSVLETICTTLKDAWGNPASCHESGRKAAMIIDQSRQDVARMIDANPRDIIFTSGGTEANNWILHIAIRHYHEKIQEQNHTLSPRTNLLPHVITTNIEHDSIRLPLEKLVEEKKLEVSYVPVNTNTGSVDKESVLSAIKSNTCLITIMLANNETGAIQPVEKICHAITEVNKTRHGLCSILTHTDAAQAIGKIAVNVKDLEVDYLSMAGHKFYGPRIGALYARNPNKECAVYPMMYGGGQENGLRPGTENVAMIAGLGKAAQLIADNLDRYTSHMKDVRDYLKTQLQLQFIDKIHINNDFPNVLPNTCNVSFVGLGLEGFKVLDTCRHLEASVGAACHSSNTVSPVLIASGTKESLAENALRLSVGRDTTKSDVDLIVADLRQSIQSLTNIHDLGIKPQAEQTKALDYSLEKN